MLRGEKRKWGLAPQPSFSVPDQVNAFSNGEAQGRERERNRPPDCKTRSPGAAATAHGAKQDGRLGKLTEREATERRVPAQSNFIVIDFHRPALPMVTAAQTRDAEVRRRLALGIFDREPKADFAARVARKEFCEGVRKRGPR